MRYIIMCGGTYLKWETPRQLTKIGGESLVARTIRLLRENDVDDIAISSDNEVFEQFGVPVLKHSNLYIANGVNNIKGSWYNAFYPMNSPVCYLFGDVVYSPNAIKTIVETLIDDIELFASAPPFASEYPKPWAEPFALKVMDNEHLLSAIREVRRLDAEGKFWRRPIVWELWQVIKGTPINYIITDYTVINDYTCDIDNPEDIRLFNFK